MASVEAAAFLQLDPALDLDDVGGARQPQFAGKAPVAAEPVDLADYGDVALFDAAVAFVALGEALQACPGRLVEAVVAKAETRCSAGLSRPRSWLRRSALPSSAASSGRSGAKSPDPEVRP